MAANIVSEIKDNLTFENVLMAAMKTPGVKVDRETFLRKELKKYCSEDILDEAIKYNPAKAGVSKLLINKVSSDVIKYETTKVTGLSALASLPGGGWAVGAAAADITSYFVFILRTVQELAYLYGFEQFELKEDEIDSETLQQLLIFIGTMFGVQGAASALSKLSNLAANKIAKNLAKQALTKTAYYPLIKKIAEKVGVHMTKQIFADTVASAVPIAGALLSGGLTYVMFKPNCMKLRKNLMSYPLCDPNFYKGNGIETTDA